MDFIIFLAIIFVLIGFIVKISDINDKVDKDEELTKFEITILNFSIGFIQAIIFLSTRIIILAVAFFMIYVPVILVCIIMLQEISTDLIPFAIVLGLIISSLLFAWFKYLFKCDSAKKENNENEENMEGK